MTALRKCFQNHLTFKRFSPKTHEAYIGAVKGLATHYGKSPDKLSDEQIQDYFVYLLEERKYGRCQASCRLNIKNIVSTATPSYDLRRTVLDAHSRP